MKALVVERLTGPAGVAYLDVGEPHDPNRIVIDVVAAAVGFPDLLVTQGGYQTKIDVPFIAGSEVAGVVRHAPRSSRYTPGDRVVAFTSTGAFAETVAADEAMTWPLGSLSFAEGARLCTSHQTAYYALVHRGRAAADETALITGAGGGLGGALVDIATALGLRVIASADTDERRARARALGAAVTIDPAARDLREQLRAAAPAGLDLILDPVGGDALTTALRALAPQGRVVVLGFASGEISQLPANQILVRNADVLGAVWGAAVQAQPTLAGEIWAELLTLHGTGRISTPDGPEYALADGASALADLAERRITGKALLRIRREAP